MSKGNGVEVDSFHSSSCGEVFRRNDCVLMMSDDDDKPFIGRILEISKERDGHMCRVSWFYRPEECEGGRQVFHGERELLKSDHVDWVSEKTFISKCRVHTITEYQGLRETVDAVDFFSRIEYKPHTREFKPDKVEVYCVCELPYNPDKFMGECSMCKEWYHPACVESTEEAMTKSDDWTCMFCLKQPCTVQRVAHAYVPNALSRKGPADVQFAQPNMYHGHL